MLQPVMDCISVALDFREQMPCAMNCTSSLGNWNPHHAAMPLLLHVNLVSLASFMSPFGDPFNQPQPICMISLSVPFDKCQQCLKSTVDQLDKVERFIQQHNEAGSSVCVHCLGGHGWSAATVFAWLTSKDPQWTHQCQLNQGLCSLPNVGIALEANEHIEFSCTTARKRWHLLRQ